jgi:TonB family protein
MNRARQRQLLHKLGGRVLSFVAATVGFAAFAHAAPSSEWTKQPCSAEELAIETRFRSPNISRVPEYPQECRYKASFKERVALKFDVDNKGRPKEIRVTESSNACLDEVARKAAKSWRYRCVGEGLSGVETALHFSYSDVTYLIPVALEDEAPCSAVSSASKTPQILFRRPPRYPMKCASAAQSHESVMVEFDVTPQGRTTEIRVKESSYSCLNEEAITSVASWRYSCVPEGQRDLETLIHFELEGPEPNTGVLTECGIFDPARYSDDEVLNDPSLVSACRTRPDYPSICYGEARKNEHVILRFDVTPEGQVTNATLKSSSNECFEPMAMVSLKQIAYAPSETGYRNLGALFRYRYEKISK